MMQREDQGLWIPGVIVGRGTGHHQGRSYQIKIKGNQIIIRNTKHIRILQIPTKVSQPHDVTQAKNIPRGLPTVSMKTKDVPQAVHMKSGDVHP